LFPFFGRAPGSASVETWLPKPLQYSKSAVSAPCVFVLRFVFFIVRRFTVANQQQQVKVKVKVKVKDRQAGRTELS
jgi:hypothetical protein